MKQLIGTDIFQFTTSQGGRRGRNGGWGNDGAFQFTTSQGGRPFPGFSVRELSTFNSRPHKEVDLFWQNHGIHEKLSIHDLTRRSTLTKLAQKDADYALSIHDLTRRSTVYAQRKESLDNAFQFTTSQGGRLIPSILSCVLLTFQFTTSQGGRPHLQRSHPIQTIFQFTTSQGGRLGKVDKETKEAFFQFTTSQGGRQTYPSKPEMHLSFNSRPHKEVDDYLCQDKIQTLHFQFTTSQGGRHWNIGTWL